MHLLLTDILTCPRCGPSFGLILLAERLEDRRVLEGSLGCANCRERYPISGGFADLRERPELPQAQAGAQAQAAGAAATPGSGASETPPGTRDEEPVRLAALLGLSEPGGHHLLVGELARHARAISELTEGTEVVAAWDAAESWAEASGVSRLAAAGLPFASRSLRGVALAPDSGIAPAEAARVVAPLGRLVLVGWPGDVAPSLAREGLEVLAAEGDTLVAARLASG